MTSTRNAKVARGSRIAALVTAGGAIIIVLSLVYATDRIETLSTETQELLARRDNLSSQVQSLDGKLAQKRAEIERLRPLALAGLGHEDPANADPAVLAQGLDARVMAQRLALEGLERRRSVVVRYYPKEFERDVNEAIVLPALSDHGFRLERGVSRVQEVPTNAVWCGRQVHPDDVRLVALTLVAAGLEIKAIREFSDPTGPKKHVIEIGADASLSSATGLTIEEIRDAEGFQRR
ncbi:MAG: hypothetical protein HYX75_14030 [Acidobacteria bacterium]|nr:hypothetical protein [Acidobacteriota bacterium]